MELQPPDPRLGDELVELRPWLDRDVPAIVAACNDPETARWTTVPSPYSEEDARAWLERRCYLEIPRRAASLRSSGGCVTNSAARPSSANGLTV